MSVFQTILCSLNLAEENDEIISYTRDIAKINNAKVHLVYSLPSSSHLRNVDDTGLVDNLIAEAEKKATSYLEKLVEKEFQGINTEIIIAKSTSADHILEIVDKCCAEVIIMGSLSTKGLLSFLSPKPTQYLVGKTRVPVIVIPNDLSLECYPKD